MSVRPDPNSSAKSWTEAEIDRGIAKLQKRVDELQALQIQSVSTAQEEVALSNTRETIADVFGERSREAREHGNQRAFWHGPIYIGMSPMEIIENKDAGRLRLAGVVGGLIARLQEKGEELWKEASTAVQP